MRIGVRHLPLACCAMESGLAMRLDLPFVEGSLEVAAVAPGAEYDLCVLVVAGTVTRAGAEAVVAAWEALPEPRKAIAYGVCAASGGPYWDAPTVVPGVGELMPVDRFVPGCPPPSSALLDAVLAVASA